MCPGIYEYIYIRITGFNIAELLNLNCKINRGSNLDKPQKGGVLVFSGTYHHRFYVWYSSSGSCDPSCWTGAVQVLSLQLCVLPPKLNKAFLLPDVIQ